MKVERRWENSPVSILAAIGLQYTVMEQIPENCCMIATDIQIRSVILGIFVEEVREYFSFNYRWE